MKRKNIITVILTALVILFSGLIVHGAYTTSDIDFETVANADSLWELMRDIHANQTSNSYTFTPTGTTPQAVEGKVYFNNDSNSLQLYNGTAWQTVDAAGGVGLDAAYDFGGSGSGRTILATDGAVQITNTENDTASLLGLTYSGNTTGDGLTITMSVGSGDGIEIENTGTGYDIEGTGALWFATKAGAITMASGTTSGDFLFTGNAANVEYDNSSDTMHLLDAAILGIGGATTAAGDFTFAFDGTDLNMESAAGDDYFRMGETTQFLFVIHGATNTNEITFSTADAVLEAIFDGFDLRMNDDDMIIFGDGATDSFTMDWDESLDNLLIVATTANDAVQIGDATTNTDFKMMGTTSGDFILFDSSADEFYFEDQDLALNEGSVFIFRDSGNATDWAVKSVDDEVLLFLPTETTDDQSFNIGNATYTADLRLFGATASTVVYDASANIQINTDYNVNLTDADELRFGTGATAGAGDFTMKATNNAFSWLSILTDETPIVSLGADQAGIDLKLFGATTGAYGLWDASGDAVWFDKADIAFSEGDGLLFGDTLGTGDFRMDSTAAVLHLDVVAAGTGSIEIGNDADDVPLKWFGETASSYFQFTGDTFNAVASNITLDATSELYDAVLAGTKVVSGTPVTIVFRPDAAATLTWTVPTGYDLIVTDAIAWKTAGAGAHADDEWELQHNDGSAANIFDKEELNTIGDKARILFDNLDDAENELEAGETLDLVALENAANGCDGIIIVSGYLKTAD